MRDFYFDTLNRLLLEGAISRDDSILVTCGGIVDRDVLLRCNVRRASISNVDRRANPAEFAPYDWSFQDAERLSFEDGAFDVVLAHSGLHHCRSPHRALLEMHRVARKAVIVFEPRDGVLTRLGQRLGFGQEYEHAAVVAHGLRYGGVANTQIPNYVYRWNPREVRQTINSFAPHARHRFLFYHALRIPHAVGMRSRIKYFLLRAIDPVATQLARVLPFFANNICFVVLKPKIPADLHPWLTDTGEGPQMNEEWVRTHFKNGASQS